MTWTSPFEDSRGVPPHPSHDIEENWNAPDPHSPGWQCQACCAYACALCDLEADDPLALPCEGG